MIITPDLIIDDNEIEEKFVRASGPGGQHVNKVSTAVQLRFDVLHSPSLPEAVRERLMYLAAGRISSDGILIIEARRFRSQEKNRGDARQRLAALILRATVIPKRRKPTKPTASSQERRMEDKKHQSRKKELRRNKPDGE